MRKVDVAQVGTNSTRLAHVPQLQYSTVAELSEQLPVALADEGDTVQSGQPGAPQLDHERRLALLAEAPTQLTLRIESRRLGEVQIRMTDRRSVEIQLSSLVETLADRFGSSEMRTLAKILPGTTFVTFDELRSAGIDLHYDPVYDELNLSA